MTTPDKAALTDYEMMTDLFTRYARTVADWKHRYAGAAYSTRLKAAIADMKFAIAEAEKHPEIAPAPAWSLEKDYLKVLRVARAAVEMNAGHMSVWSADLNVMEDVAKLLVAMREALAPFVAVARCLNKDCPDDFKMLPWHDLTAKHFRTALAAPQAQEDRS